MPLNVDDPLVPGALLADDPCRGPRGIQVVLTLIPHGAHEAEGSVPDLEGERRVRSALLVALPDDPLAVGPCVVELVGVGEEELKAVPPLGADLRERGVALHEKRRVLGLDGIDVPRT